MRILLIRHGESVDNVAGLYAGSRDSPLTNHGVLQTKRLGAHTAKRSETIGLVKHIFTSNLQRAYHTAEAIAKAISDSQEPPTRSDTLKVIRLPELREKDYGSSEGKTYRIKTGNKPDNTAQTDSETNSSLKTRANRFLDLLMPIIDEHVSDHFTVVIVAHGIILGVLLTTLLERSPLRSSQVPDHVAWSNTGVLQLKLEPNKIAVSGDNKTPPTKSCQTAIHSRIESINNVEHLEGLKKTRGGIGSAKFDSRQRTMDTFFTPTSKKRKLEEEKDL